MKKKLLAGLAIGIFIFGMAGMANAALIDRGGGLIYDNVLDVTWLQDANYANTSGYDSDGLMIYLEAQDWVDTLIYGDHDDWRLPSTDVNGDGNIIYGQDVSEIECRDNELAYMYFHNIGATYGQNMTGVQTVGTVTLNEIYKYQLSETPTLNNIYVWLFHFDDGSQNYAYQDHFEYAAWAVHDGDIASVPIPGAVWLLGSGLAGLVGLRRKKKA